MNPEQEHLADLSVGNVLDIAPAGCGKTEAIAGRARAVLLRGDVVAPRTILSLTFSNKAKENLAQRMRTIVGAGWRQRLVVTNFHGLAARVIKAHGRVVGITEGVVFPEESWRRQVRADLGITYKNGDDFEEALRLARDRAAHPGPPRHRSSWSAPSAQVELGLLRSDPYPARDLGE